MSISPGMTLMPSVLISGADGGSAAGQLGAGAVLIVIAISIFSPQIVKPMASIIGAPLQKIGGLTGRLARENSQRKPSRTAVTSAALMSENKQMSQPASVDSTPTSANQEDHVSMACHGARRLLAMTDNLFAIIGIETLAGLQGVDLRAPLATAPELQRVRTLVRDTIPALEALGEEPDGFILFERYHDEANIETVLRTTGLERAERLFEHQYQVYWVH